MKCPSLIFVLTLAVCSSAGAQSPKPVAAHSPAAQPRTTHASGSGKIASMAVKPVARVNGATLTEVDLLREMYTIFPYAQQHNGFPKDMESEIRRGALEMIIFEELLYQDAKKRGVTIAPEKIAKAELSFRKQFPDDAAYKQYLGVEMKGDKTVLREKIRRSLLIEQALKTEVNQKSVVTLASAKAFYDKNGKQFEQSEKFSIQTISIIPPQNATEAQKSEAKAKIKDIARLGREAKTARDFGLIAEQLSEDDWRTKLGDRGPMDAAALPAEVVSAARALKQGQTSDPIAVQGGWVVIRLNAHTPAGKAPFSQVKNKLMSDLRKQKQQEIRAALGQKLRKSASIEVL